MLSSRALDTRSCQLPRSSVHCGRPQAQKALVAQAVRTGRSSGRTRQRLEEDDDDNETGWWEKPGAFEDANPLDKLTPWQTRRLEQAYAVGRRKVQVSTLAKELDLDRSIVTEWFKRFSKLPESEQSAILSERRREIDREEAKSKAKANTTKGSQRDDSTSDDEVEKGGGFIPYQVRRTMPRDKKFKQDVLRTLEMVFERTPYPSDDVIRSLWDLHKIPRSMAIEWFANKRKETQPATSQAEAASASGSKQAAKGQRGSKQKAEQPGTEQVAGTAPALTQLDPDKALTASSRPVSATSAETSTSTSAGKQDRHADTSTSTSSERKPRKQRFDDVKVVITDETPAEPEPSTSVSPQAAKGQTIENLVEAYGELLVKAAKKDKLDELMDLGEDRPSSWRDAWRHHRMVNGLPRWRRINWSAWYDRLSYESDKADELQLLDADDEQSLLALLKRGV